MMTDFPRRARQTLLEYLDLIERVQAAIEASGHAPLTPMAGLILLEVAARQRQSSRSSDLARQGIFGGNATYNLHTLERKGFLQRVTGGDKRTKSLRLTAEGWALARRIFAAIADDGDRIEESVDGHGAERLNS